MELVEAVEETEEAEDRDGDDCVSAASLPQRAPAEAIEPHRQQQEEHGGQQIHPGGEASEQVEAQGAGSDKQGATATGLQPLVFEAEAGEGEETDVIVLHHVLRVVEVGGSQQKGEHTRDGLVDVELKLAEKPEADEGGQHRDKDLRQPGDDDVAHGGIGVVVTIEDVQLLDVCAEDVRRKHQEGLPDSVPALQRAVASMHAEFGIFVGKYRWLGGPEGVGGLQAVHGVGAAQLAGLHYKRNERCGKRKEKNRIAQSGSPTESHGRVSRRVPIRLPFHRNWLRVIVASPSHRAIVHRACDSAFMNYLELDEDSGHLTFETIDVNWGVHVCDYGHYRAGWRSGRAQPAGGWATRQGSCPGQEQGRDMVSARLRTGSRRHIRCDGVD